MTTTPVKPAKTAQPPKPPTLAEQHAAILAAAAARQRALDAAWDQFVGAVWDDPREAVAVYIQYRRLCSSALAEHPALLPMPTEPRGPQPIDTLLAEYDHLKAWAPAIQDGMVGGVARNDVIRRVTPQERTEFAERLNAYRQQVAKHQQTIEDYLTWRHLMTDEERHQLGPDGNYRARLPEYERRAKEHEARTGTPVSPGPRGANPFGFAPPTQTLGLIAPSSTAGAVQVPALTLRSTAGFDAALELALAATQQPEQA